MFNVDALAGRWCWLYNSIYCAQCIAEAGAIALKERFAATHTHIRHPSARRSIYQAITSNWVDDKSDWIGTFHISDDDDDDL